MWINNRYVATRDPSKGGLYISATTEGFSEDIKDEIYDNCLELIAKDYEHVCTGIYPLNNGSYSIAMGYKVAGSMKETRPHEVIRGVIADPEELMIICEKYIVEGNLEKLFFPCAPNPDRPEAWKITEVLNMEPLGALKQFWNDMDYKDVLSFATAMKIVKEKQYKIHLIVTEEAKHIVLAACCSIVVQTRIGIFIMADGECTLTMPDILITDKLLYLDSRKYHSMTLKQFIRMGYSIDSDNDEFSGESVDEVKDLLDFCKDYLISDEIFDFELYQEVDTLMIQNRSQYYRFRRILKNQLYFYRHTDYHMEHYMKLLYIAFKTDIPVEQNLSVELCTAPYDFYGMFLFLKKKAKSRREYRKLLTAMLETQFMEPIDHFTKKVIHETAVNLIDDM